MATPCDHSGTHSGLTRYSPQTGQLRLVVVCDRCGWECDELGRVDYRPRPVSAVPSRRPDHRASVEVPAD
jgi:hypothetical protein